MRIYKTKADFTALQNAGNPSIFAGTVCTITDEVANPMYVFQDGTWNSLVIAQTNPVTGVIEVSGGGGPIIGVSQAVGGLLTITGTTDPVLYPILDFSTADLQGGDVVETEAIWTYTSSTNAKSLALAYGPDEATAVNIAASSRAVSGEVLFIMRTKLWFESSTQFILHTSIMAPFANQSQALGVKTCTTADKLYLKGTLASSAETLSLRAQSTIVTRAPR